MNRFISNNIYNTCSLFMTYVMHSFHCHDLAFPGLPKSHQTMPLPDRLADTPSHMTQYLPHHNAGGLDTHSPDDTRPGMIHNRHNGSNTALS